MRLGEVRWHHCGRTHYSPFAAFFQTTISSAIYRAFKAWTRNTRVPRDYVFLVYTMNYVFFFVCYVTTVLKSNRVVTFTLTLSLISWFWDVIICIFVILLNILRDKCMTRYVRMSKISKSIVRPRIFVHLWEISIFESTQVISSNEIIFNQISNT